MNDTLNPGAERDPARQRIRESGDPGAQLALSAITLSETNLLEIIVLRSMVNALMATHPDRAALRRTFEQLFSLHESERKDSGFARNYPADDLQIDEHEMKPVLAWWRRALADLGD